MARSTRKSTRTVNETDLHPLLVAIHYSIHFDGGLLPIEYANPVILKHAQQLKLIYVRGYNGRADDLDLTDDGRMMALAALQLAEVDPEDSEAIAEWAQSVSPRVKAFENTIDTWSKLELHALESMINELRR